MLGEMCIRDRTKTYPVFINYHKDQEIQDSIRYEDRFIRQDMLIAISKSGRSLESEDVYTALHARELGVDVYKRQALSRPGR